MDCIRVVGDRLVVEVDGSTESTSQMFARLVRAGSICRSQGITKLLYMRRGGPVDALTAAEVVKSLPEFGFMGCRIAAYIPHTEAAYPWMFLEQLAAARGIAVQICATMERADAFLDGADPIPREEPAAMALCA